MAMEAKVLPDSFNPLLFDEIATHFVQSWVWGEVRKKTGTKVVRIGLFQGETLSNIAQITFHKLPKVNKSMAHIARSKSFSKEELDELAKIGKEQGAIALRLEPNVLEGERQVAHPKLKKSSQHVFVPHNFLLDLTKSEDDLLAAMHPKTRYNIRVAQKNGVVIAEQTNQETLETFIALQKKTSKRQQFFLHPDEYYRTVFAELLPKNMVKLLVAKHPQGQIISIWFIVMFKDTFTYLYGASDHEYRQLMGNNLLAWEAIRMGKQLGYKVFDFGGTYSNITNTKDPRFGVHRFKAGFNPQHVTYVGTFDLVLEPFWYYIFTVANTIRWWLLRIIK